MGLFYYKIFDRQVHIRVHHPVAPAKESADQGQQSAHSGQRDFYLPGAQILFYGAQGLSGLSGLLLLYRAEQAAQSLRCSATSAEVCSSQT